MKESNFDRIFSPTEAEEKKVQEYFKRTLESQEAVSFQTERNKSPDELEIIKFLDQETDIIAKEFGGRGMQILDKYIHIIQEDEFNNIRKTKQIHEAIPIADAFYREDLQTIIIKDSAVNSFVHNVVHEMLHMKSFQSLRTNLKKEPNRAFNRRIGLSIVPRENLNKFVLNDLTEAITEYLVSTLIHRWAERRNSVPQFLQEKIKNLSKIDFVHTLYSPTYVNEQLSLMEIMDKIIEKKPDEFKNREDALRIFGEAYFTGKLLKLRKLIDDVYGRGSFVGFAEKGLPKSKWEKEQKAQ